jgi:uncharacterized protein YbjT (DUF2867 family)
MDKKTAIVFGASGLIGGELTHQILESPNYSSVVLAVRTSINILHEKLREVSLADFDQIDLSHYSLSDIHVFCCLGTTIKKAGNQASFRKVDFELPVKIATWARAHGIETLLVISSIGAKKGTSNFYLQTKGEMEDALLSQKFKKLHILRPSLLLGVRKEFRLAEELTKPIAKLFSFFLFGKLKKYRAIEAKKVARAMISLATSGISDIIIESDRIQELGA